MAKRPNQQDDDAESERRQRIRDRINAADQENFSHPLQRLIFAAGGDLASPEGATCPEELGLSADFCSRFNSWRARSMEPGDAPPSFDRHGFNEEGRILACELQQRVAGKYAITYRFLSPAANPNPGIESGWEEESVGSADERRPLNSTQGAPENTISIMAQFGFGAYAWLKPAFDETSSRGRHVADSLSGFPDHIPVSDSLEHEFAQWIANYEEKSLERDFDWNTYNSRGLELSCRLKLELGATYRVIFCEEDSARLEEKRIEILLPD